MRNRILATNILWILVILLPWLLGQWGAFLIIAVFGIGSFIELLALLRKAGQPSDPSIGIPAFAVLLLAMILLPPWIIPPFAILMIGLSATVTACLLKAGIGSFGSVAVTNVGAIAIMLLPFGSATLMIHESGMVLPIWILAVAKFGDVGALLTGSWLGRHRMAPAFSPNKTWEGFAGGILFSVIVSVGFVFFGKAWLPAELTPFHAAWAAVFISIAGVFGDLLESAFKREANVKDSGRVIPGIGGFLDLTDSTMLAFPVAYFIIWLIF